MYFLEPDGTAHKTGTGSEDVKTVIKKLDATLGELFQRFKVLHMYDNMNFMFVSDHGFANSTERVVLVDYAISEDEYTTNYKKGYYDANVLHVYPNSKFVTPVIAVSLRLHVCFI